MFISGTNRLTCATPADLEVEGPEPHHLQTLADAAQRVGVVHLHVDLALGRVGHHLPELLGTAAEGVVLRHGRREPQHVGGLRGGGAHQRREHQSDGQGQLAEAHRGLPLDSARVPETL